MKTLKYKIKSLFLTLAVLALPALALAGSVTYEYDAFDRLERAIYDNGPVVEYTYDEAGNLKFREVLDTVVHVSIASVGDGGVSLSSDPVAESCGDGCYMIDSGASVTLTATPGDNNYFSGWNIETCDDLLATCTVTLSNHTYVEASFETCPVARIQSTEQYYMSLQDAYNAASSGDTILVNGIEITPDNSTLHLDHIDNITVTIQGGYDCKQTQYITDSVTTIKGDVTVNNGTVTMKDIVVSP